MQVTRETTVESLLEKHPDILEVFHEHGVEVEFECVGVTDFPLELCEDMCHIADIDQLITDLQEWIDAREGSAVAS